MRPLHAPVPTFSVDEAPRWAASVLRVSPAMSGCLANVILYPFTLESLLQFSVCLSIYSRARRLCRSCRAQSQAISCSKSSSSLNQLVCYGRLILFRRYKSPIAHLLDVALRRIGQCCMSRHLQRRSFPRLAAFDLWMNGAHWLQYGSLSENKQISREYSVFRE